MKIIVSKYIGPCFGVKNAINEVFSFDKNVKLLGNIVHNERVLNEISKMKNVEILHDISNVHSSDNIITRAHGITLHDLEILKGKNASIIDKTCPNVKFIHKIAEKCSLEKNQLIIVGDMNHPEVIGIKSRCENSVIVRDINEINECSFDKNLRTVVVSQTTFNIDSYDRICSHMKKIFKNLKIYNTICRDSINRKKELIDVFNDFDMIIVIGSKMSSNSVKLFDLAKNLKNNSIMINDESEINESFFEGIKSIFVTSGASVMTETIERIINKITIIGG